MSALMVAGSEATTADILAALDAKGVRSSLGAIYTTLHRMITKQHASRRKGEPSNKPGGKAKIFYALTMSGRSALIQGRQSAGVWDIEEPARCEADQISSTRRM